LNLSSKQIKKQISEISGSSLKIFDGEISLPTLELKEIESIEELEGQLQDLETQINQYEALLPVAKNFEEFTNSLHIVTRKIKVTEEKLIKIKSLPQLEVEISELATIAESLKNEKVKTEKELKIVEELISRKEDSLGIMSENKRQLDGRSNELRQQKSELEAIPVDAIEFDSNESLTNIYKKIKIHNNDRDSLKIQKDKYFDNLRNKLNSTQADEADFIKFVEDEIACINDKENSIEGLLKSISTHFSNPAFTLLAKYEDFKQFVNNKINAKLSKTKISDIESLKIEINDNKKAISDLKKISEIQDFAGQLFADLSQSDNLILLNNYLDNGKKVGFDELFDIELHLTVKGKEKKVDLAKQVESDGTDRMIRLIIIMSLIHRMMIKSEENRITIFIDEIASIDEQNRPELVKFCNEHLFIPIFAAPGAYPDFNKYYFIYPSKGKININEQHNVMWNERN
jgi:hypothetical protein